MTPAELQSTLRASGIYAVGFGGANYQLPTLAWLQNTFYPAMRQELFGEGITAWSQAFNCRLFTLDALVFADKCDAETVNAAPGTDTLAIGSFWFVPDAARFGNSETPGLLAGTYSGEGHAILCCVTDQGIKFLDPQSNTIWALSAAELNSQRLTFFP